jgi:hypothetical protein
MHNFGIRYGYKLPFDIILNNPEVLESWVKFKDMVSSAGPVTTNYQMTTAWWNSSWAVGTFAWFARYEFVAMNFQHFRDIDSMLAQHCALEKIWQNDMEARFNKNQIYIHQDYAEMFGPNNVIDLYHAEYPA